MHGLIDGGPIVRTGENQQTFGRFDTRSCTYPGSRVYRVLEKAMHVLWEESGRAERCDSSWGVPRFG